MTSDRVFNKDALGQPSRRAAGARDFILSSDPNKAMQQMMKTIDTMRDVFLEENDALKSSDTSGFLSLQDKKISIARDYQNGTRQLLERKADLKHIDVALKDALRSKQKEFSDIMSENLQALDQMRSGVKRLNDRMVRGACDAVQKSNLNYSANGSLHKNKGPVSIGLSESA
jgi:hypothetical protein